MNTTDQQTGDYPESDNFDCRTRIFSGTDLVVCLMESPGCPWAMPYGNECFCRHASAKQFVNLPQGAASRHISIAPR